MRRAFTALIASSALAGAIVASSAAAQPVGSEPPFYDPRDVFVVGSNLYIVDGGSEGGAAVYRGRLSTGEVTTIIGPDSPFYDLDDIEVAGSNAYVSDDCAIYRVNLATKKATLLAGDPEDCDRVDGSGGNARVREAKDMQISGSFLYFSEEWDQDFSSNEFFDAQQNRFREDSWTNHCTAIRRLNIATRAVQTLVVGNDCGVTTDLYQEVEVCPDECFLVWEFVGSEFTPHSPPSGAKVADISDVEPIALAGSRLYFGDNDIIEMLNGQPMAAVSSLPPLEVKVLNLATKNVTHIADVPACDEDDEEGQHYRHGMVVSGSWLYVSTDDCHQVLKFRLPTGHTSVLAGSGDSGYIDGIGTAAEFDDPNGMAIAGSKLYVADEDNGCIRVVNIATQHVGTVFGPCEFRD